MSSVMCAACYRGGMDTAVRSERASIAVRWLGRIDYRSAWALQRELVEARVAGTIPDQLLLLEHPAVLTLGRHADDGHVRASAAELERRGIEVIRVERGGEVTYHGPGQLVAYPILALSRRGLLIRCWVEPDGPEPRKIGALGLRVERGVCFHGIALNVNPAMADFELLDACGMPGVTSTSIASELGRPAEAPSTAAVEGAATIFGAALIRRLAAEPAGQALA